ncbi:hypothetical protein [Yimella sp. cx-51]|uniref:hypothetical protein n=1 Tax=Yimella sp. cx-51 TaxID=2770551 RepID=UPI00165D584D|nr:hypothetical protein [Yimella sp. cx-51]MBC9958049.1 hypothetical protein [Yimella sp. cx-51]QTH38166.1 hypothetical protein J5M86_00220 [Yimella sp. cx-51]
MLDDAEIRRRLMLGSDAAFAFDRNGLDAARVWITALSAAQQDLVDNSPRRPTSSPPTPKGSG